MKTLVLLTVLLMSVSVWAKKPTKINFNQALMESVKEDVSKDDQSFRGGRAPASLDVPNDSKKPTQGDRLEDQQNNLRETERMNQRQIGPTRW